MTGLEKGRSTYSGADNFTYPHFPVLAKTKAKVTFEMFLTGHC